ncbi:PREDICTED: KAT8 regulatory NSL complex subunit 1-like protein isoform X1 [Gavialis gangeticus]|uniref:KAT8 regulatory NSL complex subunit 1-like protein isoform X1 n=1 Tax=Gavialis gangeticus TaxID=94835 RepID=UPI00092ED07B|nr:PREDICTED: KAT8 regulatory NSL complex subunit 1-like protein isoform X1 [Gavialis gangeticus]
MTPALREAATKSHGIHLSPSLSSRAMESDTALCMENPRAVEEKLKEDSVTQITCSVLGFPTTEPNYNNDIFSVKHFGSPQSSKHYQSVLLMSANSALNSINGKQWKLGEHTCSKVKNPLHNSVATTCSQISNSEAEEQVKGETFSETVTQSFEKIQRLLDSNVTESGNTEEMQFPNGKWFWKNGFLGKALAIHTETEKGPEVHQVLHNPLEAVLGCSATGKEEELNARFHQCVSKQQVLFSRTKRTQKRLQMLLAKHVVKHCDQQLKCLVQLQLQKVKFFNDSAKLMDGISLGCTENKTQNSTANLENNSSNNTHNGFCVGPGEVRGVARSTSGLLSRVEKDLDSDATCSSSSDEDCDEQTVKKTMEANCSSEWKWLADRARVGCRWTWLQAQISELEYKIQQLTDLHRQIRATKGMVILEECLHPKGILKRQTQLTDQEALLNTAGNSQAALKRQDSLPEHDFEMSPSSPTLLLRNIEKQSAQLSEIISSLIAPLNLSPTSSPLSSKSGKHKQLVNGISFRASDNREEISSSAWILDQQHIKKRRKERTRLRSPSVTIASMCARTRPLQRFQKRKLYRMNKGCCWNSQALLSKDASFLYNTQLPCMAPASTWSSYEQSMKSRILKHMPELDSSFHPVLSFPSDIPLHMYFETLLKKDEIRADPVDTSALGVEFQTSPSSDCNQRNASLRQWSSGYLPNSKPQAVLGTSDQVSDGRKKRHLSETAIGESNSRFEAFSFQHTGPESLNSFTAVSNVNVLSRSTPSQHNARRRLRSESSYDIDNIVIPMSLVAPSKLEKLQYKEILTPSWRVVDLQPLEQPPICKEEMEDLSDEAFTSRHAQYEEREKTRWSLWEQSRWPRRNSRSYSKNADGRHGQDPIQKENHGNSCASLHYFAEATPELISETRSSVCLALPQTSTENQEAKSELWELRVFPLKDEEIETLLCQDQITNQTESSSAAFHNNSFCTSCTPFGLSNNGHPLQKQSSEELEDCANVCLGINSMRKHR